MSRFTGRAKEKITIPTKSIPTGFKGWVIIDKGYFLYWFWYTKGNSPQGIGKVPKPLKKIIVKVITFIIKNIQLC